MLVQRSALAAALAVTGAAKVAPVAFFGGPMANQTRTEKDRREVAALRAELETAKVQLGKSKANVRALEKRAVGAEVALEELRANPPRRR